MSKPASSAPSLDDSMKQQAPNNVEGQLPEKQPTDPEAPQPPEDANPWHPSQFPDGGRDAWLCLLGAACCLFCSFGWINCLGVFQNYYQANQLSNYSPSTVSWISSLEIFIMFLPGPIVGFLYDNHGPKYILLFGTFFHVFGLMMTSLCTEYYQFVLAQGICSPLGLNCIFNAGTNSITTWFFKKRGAAYGIMAAGSGLGGVLFPIMASHLIPRIGFAWTMRVFGFVVLGLLGIAFTTVKSRLPPKPRAFQLQVFTEPFKDMRFVLIVVSSFLFFMGMFIPINFIEVQASASGMSSRLAGYLLSVLNAASIFGRIIPGILADKLGRFNMQIVMSYLAAIITLALALPASSNAAYIAFAALYGFASGGFVSLGPAQVAHISDVSQIGIRIGVMFSLISFAGLVGNPIAGAIVDRERGGFGGLDVFAGVLMMAGGVGFTATRMVVAGWRMAVLV